ncbi:MAG: CopG family transcriptional regulator [Thermoleophilia bacterium]|nr:ribbon-helix-helix domain-containing protein [Gaiellaceae bacterium]MDW8337618.1 CopG family transcriptional regulator [Thermoleophilia bacterium]
MRTTIRLDDELLTRAKRAAVERGTTLTAVIEDALRRALAPADAERGERFTMHTFHGDGLRPGVDLDDTASLLDVMDEPGARP